MDWLSIVVSFAALVVAYLAYRNAGKSRTSSVITELTQQANLINETAIRYRIRGPFALLLDIKPGDDVENFQALSAMFFHQINLLNIVYRNRSYLGKEVESAYRDWASTILRPWFESDQILVEHWRLVRESRDLYGRGFIEWLEPLLPIHKK
jgi:hypothetical protein